MTTNLLLSVLLGVLTSVVPNLVFSKTFWRGTNTSSRQIVKSMYWGTGLKYAVFILLGSVFFQLPNLHPIVFFWAFLLFELARLIWCGLTLPRVELK